MPQENTNTDSFGLNLKWWPQSPYTGQYAFAFISLFLILILIYSNSFHGVYVFDDNPRIVKNSYIRMERLDFDSLSNPFRDEATGRFRLWRPLAFLTFALNYYIGGLDVKGFHIVNLGVHFLAACFLFLFIQSMLSLPMLKDRYGALSYPLALLTAVFWAVHPIQVTSVTYIVQRMASMAGMFYIAAMYFYLQGRFKRGKSRFVWLTMALLAGICAVASKENAVLLVPTLVMMELILIQGASRENIIKFARWVFWISAVCAILAFIVTNPFKVVGDYSFRPFTMWERLITQPRVMMLYLGLLLYPTADKMTFLYDVPHSVSLMDPVSTLWSTLAVLGIFVAGLSLVKKSPLISFCILFFLLNHAVESTFLPLEMVYEHRNYIPSMLFFLLLFVLITLFLYKIVQEPTVRFFGLSLVTCIIIANGHTTHMRNSVFDSTYAFWTDNANKSPNLSTPTWDVGNCEWIKGNTKIAGEQFKKAFDLDRYENLFQKGKTLHNIGVNYLYDEYSPQIALGYFFASMYLTYDKPLSRQQIAICYLQMEKWENAREWLKNSIDKHPKSADLHNLMALTLFKLDKFSPSIAEAKISLSLDPSNGETTLILAEATRMAGNSDLSIKIYKQAAHQMPALIDPILAMIELGCETNDNELVNTYVHRLFSLKNNQDLKSLLELLKQEDYRKVYRPNLEILLPAIQTVLDKEIASAQPNEKAGVSPGFSLNNGL